MQESPTPDDSDHAARAADLDALARENEEAIWGEASESRARVPGVISGDVGAKGKVAAQLREQSRRERSSGRDVMPGAVVPGTGRLILLPMLAIAVGLLALVVFLGWLLT
jgi:hypothetical protein